MSEPEQIHLVIMLAWLSLVYPLGRGCVREWHSSLRHAMLWRAAAWLGWLAWLAASYGSDGDWPTLPLRYLALTLTACAGVAVLGARQPGMAAWNFVVGGLLVILLFPVVQQPWRSPHWQIDGPSALLLGGALFLGWANYLPTSRWLPAIFAVWVFVQEFGEVVGRHGNGSAQSLLPFFFVPYCWTSILNRRQSKNICDALWLDFRDRYGLVWAWRAQEQFNNAAKNAEWSARLGWNGLRWPDGIVEPDTNQVREMNDTLQGILKRFGTG